MLSDGDWTVLFSTPICWIMIVLCVLGVLSPILMERLENKLADEAAEADPAAKSK